MGDWSPMRIWRDHPCLMLLESSRPYPWLILEKNGRNADDDDDGGKISTTAGEVSSS